MSKLIAAISYLHVKCLKQGITHIKHLVIHYWDPTLVPTVGPRSGIAKARSQAPEEPLLSVGSAPFLLGILPGYVSLVYRCDQEPWPQVLTLVCRLHDLGK